MNRLKMNKFEPKIVVPSKVNNSLYYFAGLAFLAFAKIKNLMRGYKTPRTFSIQDVDRGIKYDFGVVNKWLGFLKIYSNKFTIKSKTVLELGPGADLGIGLILLMKGAKKYNAIDVHNLVKSVPEQFYDEFFNYIKKMYNFSKIDFLRSQLKLTQRGKNDKLNYVWKDDFDLLIFKNEKINLVFSQAAFEHFDNVEDTIAKLSQITKKGAVMIAEVDLKTHSRWIRDVDPLNIYRYPDFIYDPFRFRGSPNRIGPFQYEDLLKKYGWTNIKIIPLSVLDKNYFGKVKNTLNKRFRADIKRMNYLSIIVGATKR